MCNDIDKDVTKNILPKFSIKQMTFLSVYHCYKKYIDTIFYQQMIFLSVCHWGRSFVDRTLIDTEEGHLLIEHFVNIYFVTSLSVSLHNLLHFYIYIYIYIYINPSILSINLVSLVTFRSSGTDILYGCHLLPDVCIIYFIYCDCIMNSSLSYTIY